jgi:AmpD protein
MTRGGDPTPRSSGFDFVIDADGWAHGAAQPVEAIRSPNRDARPDGEDPTLIVVHNISLPPGVFGGRFVDALFTNTLDRDAHPYFAGLDGLRVSSHFLVRRDGSLAQFVSCDERAWHAGVSMFDGRERCNDFSIGIEVEGDDTSPFDGVQYTTLRALVAAVQRRYPIVAVTGHSDIAPGRKTDPGPCFDWSAALPVGAAALRRTS